LSASVIAIDAMGGDFGPHLIVPASLACLADFSTLHLVLVGQASLIETLIGQCAGVDRSRLRIEPATQWINMEESAGRALRGKSDSSMRVALELVRDGRAQACVSAGNTGALLALSRHVLKTLPGIDRPAMMASIPVLKGRCHLLDLGANLECSAEQLCQFAVMGAVAAEVQGMTLPRVGLLNVGSESGKGNQQVKQAAAMLERIEGLNYIGFVEGDGLYRGEADVLVCDGFVGNALLKGSEGLADMLMTRFESLLRGSLRTRLAGLLLSSRLRSLCDELAPAQHNGASFLGLQGVVVKSHGGADGAGVKSAIRRAMHDVRENLSERIRGRVLQLLS
jgi:glycerol-3-phosphate acyltransferase PlsX